MLRFRISLIASAICVLLSSAFVQADPSQSTYVLPNDEPTPPPAMVTTVTTTTTTVSKTKKPSVKKKVQTVLPPELDPDGDNDDKGYSSFPMVRQATGNRVFIFDPKLTAWAAYNEQGKRVNTGRASGGRAFCPDVRRSCKTVVGTFEVLSKGPANCKSKVYPLETSGGAPMPYCMKFHKKGYAVHGSNDVPNYNASHGCIRVTPKAAKWLSQDFIQTGTTIIVRAY